MTKHSAGILVYRRTTAGAEVLIVHPGGPFWAKKDFGTWSIPKGEIDPDEEPLRAAKREFEEEIGGPPPAGEYSLLGEAKQPSGKIVQAWAVEGDFNLEQFKSNMFEMEWPPKSGHTQEFPENDRAAWTDLALAYQKVVKGQAPLVATLAAQLGIRVEPPAQQDGPPPQTSLF